MANERRKEASIACFQIARNIEALLNYMNEHESDFVVDNDEKAILFEEDFHEHISKYMKLGKSFESREKP